MIPTIAVRTALGAVILVAMSATTFGQSQSEQRGTLADLQAAEERCSSEITALLRQTAEIASARKVASAEQAADSPDLEARFTAMLVDLDAQLKSHTGRQAELRAEVARIASDLDRSSPPDNGEHRHGAQDPVKRKNRERDLTEAQRRADQAAQDLDQVMAQLHEKHARQMTELQDQLERSRGDLERRRDHAHEDLARAREMFERRAARLEEELTAKRAAAEETLERALATLQEAQLGEEERASMTEDIVAQHQRAVDRLAEHVHRQRKDAELELELAERDRLQGLHQLEEEQSRAQDDLQRARELADRDHSHEMTLLHEQLARHQHELESHRAEIEGQHARMLAEHDHQAKIMRHDPTHAPTAAVAPLTPHPVVMQMQQSVQELREEVRELRGLVRQLDKIVRRAN